jgi:hypothetical protein
VAKATIWWTNASRGRYDVFFRFVTWNANQGKHVHSTWYQLTPGALTTYGRETERSGVYIGGSNGRCSI